MAARRKHTLTPWQDFLITALILVTGLANLIALQVLKERRHHYHHHANAASEPD